MAVARPDIRGQPPPWVAGCNEALASRWTFELNYISFRVGQVNRRTFPLRTISRFHRAGLNAVHLQVIPNVRDVEWFDAKAEVIEIPRFGHGCGSAHAAEFSIYWHQVDERVAGTQLNEPDLILPPLNDAAERLAIEAQHACDIDNAQYKVVDLADTEHAAVGSAG
jgi:hypothetical protein